ncbi:tyrosine-type recombinase/integrase [Desulfobacter postgatei]|uniref:tyrosine-type recombinase/integrase n=1 Tax=Desulfobacter postgatei TaxID=2293 RepID=UPI002A368EE0|nr:tyrosine-type recombinase/integrase [Desulfobacter postgatei]MDX9963623.1 tyrosine-type recombinase/integrase [Desulfobacter postgatei]
MIKVLEAANPDQRDLLEAVLRTGARIGEIVNLQWCDIDLDNRIYRLKTRKTKGGEQKTTAHAMSDSLYRIFKRRAENKHSDVPYVFWHEFYSRKTKTWRCDKYQSLGRFTERVCKKAGVKRFGLHQLRHLSASILKDEGNMSISQLQKFLRHEDQKTTEIYANHLDNETLETTTFLNKYLDKKLKTGAAGV